MGLIDRVAEVLKSYLHDEETDPLGRSSQNRKQPFTDPDIAAAYQELDDFLEGESGYKKNASPDPGDFSTRRRPGTPAQEPAIPLSIQQDFAELGLSPRATPEECKAAYKRLLKIHHPDRHAGHPGNMQKATEKSARINAAFDRIERWRQTGKTD